jgi:hypothetical protein
MVRAATLAVKAGLESGALQARIFRAKLTKMREAPSLRGPNRRTATRALSHSHHLRFVVALAGAVTACRADPSCSAGSSDPRPGVAHSCPSFTTPRQVAAIQDDALFEISGIAASQAHPGVYYVHNDSDDSARFFAIDLAGRTLGEYDLSGATAIDWEDIAIGSLGDQTDAVFLADIGDNGARDGSVAPRSELQIFRVNEPAATLGQAPLPQALSWERLRVRYPDRPHDAETLLFDAMNAELFLVTKESDGHSGVYRMSARVAADSLTVLERVGELAIPGCGRAESPLLTAGDLSRDGSNLALLSYSAIYMWPRAPAQSVAEALAAAPSAVIPHQLPTAEALAFSSAGRDLVVTGENSHPPLLQVTDSCQ